MKRSKRKQKIIKNDDHSQLDRLSSLPDTLLITILSNLPINSAAATSVLSRRWRHLWTQITHLFFQPWMNNHRHNFHQFMNTVNNVLFHLTSSKIHTFHLCFPHPYPHRHPHPHRLSLYQSNDCANLYPWIHFICRHNPEVIKFDLFEYFTDLPSLVDLPLCLFQTQSLVNLELTSKVEFKFPVNLSVNLPNLKKLHLFLCDSNYHVIDNFFNSCPFLEDLNLLICFSEYNNHSVRVFILNLKNLILDTSESFYSTTSDFRFIIDTPKLERFKIEGVLSNYDFVTIPSELQEVEISLEDTCTCTSEEKLRVFRGISCVRSLTLGGDYGISLLPVLVDIPIYSNLVHLTLVYDYSVDWYTPKLPSWWVNLKKIDVKLLLGIARDTALLDNIVSSATALEQLNVSLLEEEEGVVYTQQLLWDEYNVCKKLFKRKRSCSSCHIQFFGNMMTASSSDFNNSALTCQIKE